MEDDATIQHARRKILISTQAHHAVTAMLLLVSLRGNGAYDDLTVVLGGYGEVSTVLLCVADTFKQRPRLQQCTNQIRGASAGRPRLACALIN